MQVHWDAAGSAMEADGDPAALLAHLEGVLAQLQTASGQPEAQSAQALEGLRQALGAGAAARAPEVQLDAAGMEQLLDG